MKLENGAGAPKRKPQGNKNKSILIIAIAIVVVAVITGGILLATFMNKSGNDTSSLPVSSVDEGISSEEPVSSETDEFDPETGVLKEFADYYKENPEFIGQVIVPNTKLDSMVVKGADNSYYLNHDWQKKSDPYGAPFLDYRASLSTGFQSTNLTLYGHNSKHGDYFESVKTYSDIEYYKENPIVEFNTIYGKAKYKIIGRFTEYVVSDDFFNYHDYVNMDEKLFNEFMTELDKRNYYNSGVDVEFGDNLLTLSTCNDAIQGALNTPYRDVLVARKVRPGESEEMDVSKIEKNLDMIMPAGWVKKYGKDNPYK